jgi:Holliday junction resolvase RusA-like endonuclease
MTEITIDGLRVASKKNNRRNFRNISLPSLAYVKFHSDVAKFMKQYKGLYPTGDLKVEIEYEIKGKYHQDIDNAVSSVFDCLTDFKVIGDDEQITEVSAKKTNGHKDWKVTVRVSPVFY